MRKHFIYLCLACLCVLFSTCEKAYSPDEEVSVDPENSGNLVVRTASATDGSTSADYVTYPVSVYVMDSDGLCVALQQLESANDELKIELAEGVYDVYAVGGADGFNLPSMDNATAETLITPKDGAAYGDLMTAYCNIVMAKGEENKLDLQLQRRVMLVEEVTINNIPDDVTAVQLTVSPLRKGVLLSGDYAPGVSSYTFSLVKQEDGSTWKNATAEYLLEAVGNATLKVSLTREAGTTSYSYACATQLTANSKVKITGNFIDDSSISLSGTLKGTDWEGTVDIVFDFDSTNITTSDDTDSPIQETTQGSAPKAGTMYKGCYVLRTSTEGGVTTVTLMSPTEVNKVKVSSSKNEDTVQQSIKDNTETALQSVAVSGVAGWRLPNLEEMQYIDANVDAINEAINALSDNALEAIELKRSSYSCGYFFTADDGNVYVYVLGGYDIDTSPSSERATYKVRAFTTLTFTD